MTEIQNSKQLAFDLILDLEFICYLVLVICYFRFIRVRFLSIFLTTCSKKMKFSGFSVQVSGFSDSPS